MKLLILDANQRPALAITRSLGEKGVPLVVADETGKTLAGSSKYCKERFIYLSPYTQTEKFLEELISESNKRNIKMIFPVTDITTYLLLKNRNKFEGLIIPFASFDAYEQLTNKWNLFQLAQKLGIPIPKTYFVNSYPSPSTLTSTLHSFSTLALTSASASFSSSTLSSLQFPIVIKPYRSRVLFNGGWISASVEYAQSIEEFEKIINKKEYLKNFPFLIQEYIKGEGRGIFVLYNHGRAIAFFAHRRLREKPPSGGVSVLCESIEVDPVLKQLSQKILDYVKWHGVAMVEFKVSVDGTPYLMEVNARFWGSLQLAIDAGIDFPYLLYQMAIGKTPESIDCYKLGIKSRWLLGDLDHLYLKLRTNGPIKSKIKTFINFLNFFDKRTHYEINRFNDLSPFLFELKKYFM